MKQTEERAAAFTNGSPSQRTRAAQMRLEQEAAAAVASNSDSEQELDGMEDAMGPLSHERGVVILEHLERRWEMLHSPLHAAGLLLDPEFQQHNYDGRDVTSVEVRDGMKNVLMRMLPDMEARGNAEHQLSNFRNQWGCFKPTLGTETMYAQARVLPAWEWWLTYGGDAPELQKVALRVLSQVASAGACERNWSSYDFIHSRRRNRLKPRTAEDL
eukprot:80757-Chlamydomonas_euryale.AAC.1